MSFEKENFLIIFVY